MSLLAVALPALPPGILSFLYIPLIIAVFYFLMIRPQQTKQKAWQQMLNDLKPGDKITTTGGMRGTIVCADAMTPCSCACPPTISRSRS